MSIWLDDLSRERIESGNLAEVVKKKSVVGVTTNPTIFAAAIGDGESRGIVHPAHDGGVASGRKCCDNSRFRYLRRRHVRALNFRNLILRYDSTELGRLPVVVATQDATPVVQFQLRITQDIRDAAMGKRRSDCSNNYLGRLVQDDESANHDIITGLDLPRY